MLWIIIYCWSTDNTLIYDITGKLWGVQFLGYTIAFYGFLHFIYTLFDTLNTDIFGFREMRMLEWTGFEFPIPSSLHAFTRFNSSHRNSIYFSQLCIFGGAIFVAPLTIGR